MSRSSTTRQLAGRSRQIGMDIKRSQLSPGDMLQNRYRIMGTLGMGGFSAVYQARDMHFASVTRLCAIKEMINVSSDQETQDLARRSFETEASILATLQHPAIPDVYDYFSQDERSYLVMEFIRGKDLEATLDDRRKMITQDEALDWSKQICEVLIFLHSHKPKPIIFRDMKPSNIMLDQRGRVRVIDFGIAKVFQQSGVKGTMIGTEGYSPPEQYRGEASPAGDIYAYGATMHHLLTMKDPRMQPPFSWQERVLTEINSTVTPAFEAIINRCLAYRAGDRYTDGMALQEAIRLLEESARPATSPAAAVPTAAVSTAAPAAVAAAAADQAPTQTESSSEFDIKPLWTFKCEDEIRSQPVVGDGAVYVGAYDNNLYALNSKDGSFKWKYPATDGIGTSPFVYKRDVFFGSADQNLYCINRRNGRLQWTFATQGAVYSSPRAEFDHVFFGSDDGHLYAINASSGRLLWKNQSHSPVRSSPLITDEFIYYGTEGGYVFAVDLRGKVKWQFQAKRAVTSSPVFAEDMVFVGSMDATVYALDANSGWAIWRARTTRPIISTPVVNKDVVYIGSSDGKLYAFDLFNGRQLWAYETGGQVTSSPVVVDDAIYFGSTDGYVYSISLNKGKLRWRFKTGRYVVSSPTVDKTTIYIGSCDHHLYALPK